MPRLVSLFRHYILRRVDGTVSPAVYWALPETPRVIDDASAQQYLLAPDRRPYYPIDYRGKLRYPLHGDHGIIELNYGAPIGRQINPEAAFQYALGLHDAGLAGTTGAETAFLRYCDHFLADRDAWGRWVYRFTWFRSPNPWYSALSQGRGASVMLRAWLLTGDGRYRKAAVDAVRLFATSCEEGGFRRLHPRISVPYLEEYPFQPTAAINGFLAALIGLFEVAHWLEDTAAKAMLAEYLQSATVLLPAYTTSWWTLYDFDPESPMVNVHSPRYHRMTTGYLTVLFALTGKQAFRIYRDTWRAMDRPIGQARAVVLKSVKKLRHR